jgi:O-antigen ligase
VLAALLAAALVWSVRRINQLDAALLAVAATSVLSAMLAVSPVFSWRPALLTVVAVAVAIGAREQKERRLWLRWMGGAIAVLAAGGLIEGLGWARWSLEGRAPASLLGQRNTLAHVLVLGSPVVWMLALSASRRWERFGWLAVAAVVGAVVVMTRSRAAWLATPVVLIVFAAFATRRREQVVVLAPVAIGTLAGLLLPLGLTWRSVTPYFDSARRLFQSDAGSGAGRLEQWSQTLALFPSAPALGVGPGNWCVANAACDLAVSNRFVTSDWVALLVERGVLAPLGPAAGSGGGDRGRGGDGRARRGDAAAGGAGALCGGLLRRPGTGRRRRSGAEAGHSVLRSGSPRVHFCFRVAVGVLGGDHHIR